MLPQSASDPAANHVEGPTRGLGRRRLLAAAAVCLPLLYFVGVGLRHLERPALYHDELLFIAPAMDAGPWRLRIISYIGAVKAALYVPVFAIWEVGPASVRVPMLVVAVASLLLFHAFLKKQVGPRFAGLGLLMLCVDPSFAFLTRLDYGPNALMHLFKAASLLLLALFLETGATAALWGLVGAMLLGLYDKLNFIWIINAFGAAAVVAHGGALWRRLRESPTTRLLPLALLGAATAAVAVFLVPPLLAETQVSGQTASYAHRVPFVLGLAQRTLDGVEPYNWVALTHRLPPTGVFVALHAIVAINAAVAWRSRRRAGAEELRRWRWLLFLLAAEAAVLAQMAYTHAAHGPHHAMLLWPLPHMAAVLSAFLALSGDPAPARARPWSRTVLAAGNALTVLFIVAVHARTASQYAALYRGAIPVGARFDTRVYDLAAFLNERRDRFHRVVVLDPGLTQPLRALARPGDRLRVLNLWGAFREPPGGEQQRRRLARTHFPLGTVVLALAFKGNTAAAPEIDRNWRGFVEQTLADRVSAHVELFGLFEGWCVSGRSDCGLRAPTASSPSSPQTAPAPP